MTYNSFDDEIQRAQSQARQEVSLSAQPTYFKPEWHGRLVTELVKFGVPTMPLFELTSSRTVSPPFRQRYEEEVYARVEAGWVLTYVANYREGYVTGGTFVVTSERFGLPVKVEGGRQWRSRPAKGSGREFIPKLVRRGIPKSGAWVMRPQTPGRHDHLGAAALVARLLETGTLRLNKEGHYTSSR